jgi:glyoxylate utilization-related uncharacterized protein
MYHRENAQETFVVPAGECTLVVEDQERQLTAWDFFYCAPGTLRISSRARASRPSSARWEAAGAESAADCSTKSARSRQDTA